MSCETKPKIYKGSDEIIEIETANANVAASGVLFSAATEITVTMVVFEPTSTTPVIVSDYSKMGNTVVAGATTTSFKWFLLAEETAEFPVGKLIAEVTITLPNNDFPSGSQNISFKQYIGDVEGLTE